MDQKDKEIQRLAMTIVMMLESNHNHSFIFSVESYTVWMQAYPELQEFHIGTFLHPNGEHVVCVWLGNRTREEIQIMIDNSLVTEREVEVPIADANPSIN